MHKPSIIYQANRKMSLSEVGFEVLKSSRKINPELEVA
jgi:hypothetical protein